MGQMDRLFCCSTCEENYKKDYFVSTREHKRSNCEICGTEFMRSQPQQKLCGKRECREERNNRHKEKQKKDMYIILERDKFACNYCGASPLKGDDVKLHLDHIYPQIKGGADTADNLLVACNRCNLAKSSRVMMQESMDNVKEAIKERNKKFGIRDSQLIKGSHVRGTPVGKKEKTQIRPLLPREEKWEVIDGELRNTLRHN